MPDQRGAPVWYELMTADAAAAGRFYAAAVDGWRFGDRIPGGMDYRMILRSDGGNAGGVLTFDEAMRQGGARPAWLGYIAVDDVDSAVAAMVEDGAQVHMPARDVPGVGRLAMVADPSGAPFYLMDPEPPADDPGAVSDAFSVDQPQHVRWNELATDDPERAVAFYTRHFGWTQEGAMDMGEYGTYRFIHRDGVAIGAIMERMPQMLASLWTYYIGVADIDRAATAITANGGQILHGPQEIPGGEYSINAMDPEGATFGLVGPRLAKGDRT